MQLLFSKMHPQNTKIATATALSILSVISKIFEKVVE